MKIIFVPYTTLRSMLDRIQRILLELPTAGPLTMEHCRGAARLRIVERTISHVLNLGHQEPDVNTRVRCRHGGFGTMLQTLRMAEGELFPNSMPDDLRVLMDQLDSLIANTPCYVTEEA